MAGCVALIVAAGRGARLGAEGTEGAPSPKQYTLLCGRPMLSHAVAAFLDSDAVAAVRVVIHADDRARYDDAVGHLSLLEPVQGGASRQDSVRAGLESLAGEGFDSVLIHDAARPLVDAALIARTLEALAAHPGAVPALAVTDSLKRGAGGIILEAVERTELWRAQTPQGFSFTTILEAHRQAAALGTGGHTDDAAIAAAAGIEVALVPGAEDNFKITTREDLARAERLLAGAGETRTGQGFDVHAFGAEGSGPVRLCGVDVPHGRGLEGHSDADAGLHAATDAVLGALAEGGYGARELIVRVNGLASPWGNDDLVAVATSGAHAVLLPKVDGAAMIEQAVAYSLVRKQFDRVIGSFQAVKHMCAEMIAELEPARSLVWYAAHSFDSMPDEAPLMAAHALANLSEIGREIASVSTQVHGGIGWTEEQNLHFWFKRISSARHMLGGPEFLRNRAAELQGLVPAA